MNRAEALNIGEIDANHFYQTCLSICASKKGVTKMIFLEGLSDTLKNTRQDYLESKVVEKLIQSISEGKRECVVPLSWITYDFLDRLQDQNVEYSCTDEHVVLQYVE